MGKHAYGGSCLGEFTDVTAVLYTAHMYDKPSEGTGFMGQIVQKSSTCSTSSSCYISIHIYCSLNPKMKIRYSTFQTQRNNPFLTLFTKFTPLNYDYDLPPFFPSFSFFAFSLAASALAISWAFSLSPSLLRAICGE